MQFQVAIFERASFSLAKFEMTTICGAVAGCLIEPFNYDLFGSTFTMTRYDDAALALNHNECSRPEVRHAQTAAEQWLVVR